MPGAEKLPQPTHLASHPSGYRATVDRGSWAAEQPKPPKICFSRADPDRQTNRKADLELSGVLKPLEQPSFGGEIVTPMPLWSSSKLRVDQLEVSVAENRYIVHFDWGA